MDGSHVLGAAGACRAVLVATIDSFATALARVIDGSPPGARG